MLRTQDGLKHATNEDEKAEAVRVYGAMYLQLLDSPDTDVDASRIRTALEWAFDSSAEANQTLSHWEACIGLEALLGEDEKDELTARLADRCAYLLGRGAEVRNGIRKRFKANYEVRSKITHGRKPRLDPHCLRYLKEAQHLLANVIDAEIQHTNDRWENG